VTNILTSSLERLYIICASHNETQRCRDESNMFIREKCHESRRLVIGDAHPILRLRFRGEHSDTAYTSDARSQPRTRHVWRHGVFKVSPASRSHPDLISRRYSRVHATRIASETSSVTVQTQTARLASATVTVDNASSRP